MRNHKGKCPFQNCECPNCEMTKQRQKILNAEIQVYRKRRADLNKKLKSERKIVKSRKRLNHDEKLVEVLFKQTEEKIKNVIRKLVIRSSGNAGFDVENWISKGKHCFFGQISRGSVVVCLSVLCDCECFLEIKNLQKLRVFTSFHAW